MDEKTRGALSGKKILAITPDHSTLQAIQQSVQPKGAILFFKTQPKEAFGEFMVKNPDLVIYDERMPHMNGIKVLSAIKHAKPKCRILLLSRHAVPQRSIDTSAQGVAYTIPNNSSSEQIYNAVKHSLSITSVPRVEKPN